MSEVKTALTSWSLSNLTSGLNVCLDVGTSKQYALYYTPNSTTNQTLLNLYGGNAFTGNGVVLVAKHLNEITDFPVLNAHQARMANITQSVNGLSSTVMNFSSYIFAATEATKSRFVRLLLDPANKIANSNVYKLAYINNPLINSIYAIELPPPKKVNIQTYHDLNQYCNQFQCNLRISSLQLFLARTMLAKIKGKKVKINSNLFDTPTLTNLGAPTGTLKMQLLY